MKNIESNFKESRKYKPNKKFCQQATVNDIVFSNLFKSYQDDPNEFWSTLANQEIKWMESFKSGCTGNAPYYEWFKEGKLNISENCIDRHIKNKNDAIIHISEDNHKKVISYHDLYTHVNNLAYALRSLGLKKGSRVIIYMPTIPESIIAMLSCARLGLIHSVVFAGFSSESLKNRIYKHPDKQSNIDIRIDILG